MNEHIKNFLPYGYIKKRGMNHLTFGAEAAISPNIYNECGEKMYIFYLQNSLNSHTPYSMVAGRISDKIFWDRFNRGLPIHFYSHQDMFNTSDSAVKKFGVLRESEAIVPNDYRAILQNPEIASDFSQIFTHNEEILNKYANASFVPAYGVWYGTKQFGGELSDNSFMKKTKDISIISSDKAITKYHKLRLAIARKYMTFPNVDGYGKGCNNFIEKKADALTSYRYSIVIENGISPFYFTEKILDCFAAMTVPIYLGASKIGDFFNTDGIITFSENNIDELDDIIKGCNSNDYEQRLSAIKDNYRRVLNYLDFESYILNHYEYLFSNMI